MGREIAALDGLNEQCLKGINHTKASDASVIFSAPHIAFGMSNNIESKNKKVFA